MLKVKDNRAETLGRILAWKVVEVAKVDPLIRRRLLREVELMRELQHPNIVRLHEMSTENETLHLFMEYLAGDTLDKIAEEAKVPMWKVMMWNDDVLKSKDNIKVGQELVVFRDDEVDERASDFAWIEGLKKRQAKRILAVPHHQTALWK